MIRYSLLCANDHGFDSWFRDSAAFDALAAAAHVHCPDCGSATVRKALMTPSVVLGHRGPRAGDRPAETVPALPPPASAPEAANSAQPVALIDDRERKLRDMMRAVHREIVTKSDNVGRAFAEEARRIHDGDAEPRSIYGEATTEQVTALLEDGIPLMHMPVLPDDHN